MPARLRRLTLAVTAAALLAVPTAAHADRTSDALGWVQRQAGTDEAFQIDFAQDYDPSYVGTLQGTVGEAAALDRTRVAVQVLVHTDVDYPMQTVPVAADGTFATTVDVHPGEKIARLVNTTTGRVLASTQWPAPQAGLVRSFRLKQDDPLYGAERDGGRTEWRSWLYDDAVAALAFTYGGQPAAARKILERLAALQAADGSFGFAFDAWRGLEVSGLRRTGAVAWAGYAALEYGRVTGDHTFDGLAIALGDWVLGRQLPSGSVDGGPDVGWVSTEHNVDAYFLLRDLGQLTGEARFGDGAEDIKASLLANHWNPVQERFNQGIGDDGHALDLGSWGGLFLLAIGETAKARRSDDYADLFRVTDGAHAGHRPYFHVAHTVWAEGSWGAILLRQRLGEDVSADLAAMDALQQADGGFPQVTTALPDMPSWAAVAGTGWAVIAEAPGAAGFWAPDPGA
ncbi:MAG TPA: hypothetical protein VIL49_15030 [Capillimicrobium sp.]|jgi:hypothetical protein